MINKNAWMKELVTKLSHIFGKRLLFAGLKGSYRRGEATDTSNIDVVAILDRLGLPDLASYRTVVSGMPEGEKACGFICGKEELRRWPKHEIFQLQQETEPFFGSLEGLLPLPRGEDIGESVRISAANLYHAVCNTYLYGDAGTREGSLNAFYKSAFFILQLANYLRTGHYVSTKRKLLPLLNDREQRILALSMKGQIAETEIESDVEDLFERLIVWTGDILKEFPGSKENA